MQVELTRGDLVESAHLIDAVVAGVEGPVRSWGDANRPVIARSALKFVQALPLLRTGAADAFAVQPHELVLACSSHSAEPAHVQAVAAWLGRLGLDETALECGPDVPIGRDALVAHHRAGRSPAAILNCCSGKHAGFLTLARHLGVDHRGYIEPGHPVQQLVTAAVAELTGHPLDDQRPGRDGCGIPTFGIPLTALAVAMARLSAPDGLDPPTAAAARSLIDATVGREFWISGTGRHETVLAAASTEPILAKGGAEGVFMAALPERGLGVAVKARDGAARAAEAAISAVLGQLGAIQPDPGPRPVLNKAGAAVGQTSVRFDP